MCALYNVFELNTHIRVFYYGFKLFVDGIIENINIDDDDYGCCVRVSCCFQRVFSLVQLQRVISGRLNNVCAVSAIGIVHCE